MKWKWFDNANQQLNNLLVKLSVTQVTPKFDQRIPQFDFEYFHVDVRNETEAAEEAFADFIMLFLLRSAWKWPSLSSKRIERWPK